MYGDTLWTDIDIQVSYSYHEEKKLTPQPSTVISEDDEEHDENYDEYGNYIFDYDDSYAWIFPGMSLAAKKSTVFPQEQIESFMEIYVKHEDSLPVSLIGRNFDNSVIPYDGVQRSITCWGDSMTEGNGTNSASIQKDGQELDISYMTYPMLIEQMTGIKTYNLGVGGETSRQIAERQGGLPMMIDRRVTVPANGAKRLILYQQRMVSLSFLMIIAVMVFQMSLMLIRCI